MITTIKLFKESLENKIYYHATDNKYIDSILKNGLDINIGIKRWVNNDYPLGTYLFDDYNAALKYAILNCEDGEVLEINSKGLTILDDPEDKIDSHFEDDNTFYTNDKIPVSNIKLLNISDEEKDEIYKLYESSNKEQTIRISSSALAQIIIDDKYLLCINISSMKKGKLAYTPLGGALEYLPSGLDFLNSINAQFERTTPDLRFHTNLFNLEKYKQWFYTRKDREITIDRELVEELVDEEKIFSSLNSNDYKSIYIKTVEQTEASDNSNRFFEIFTITFSAEKLNQLLKQIEINDKLILVTKEEILSGIAPDGISIGRNSEAII